MRYRRSHSEDSRDRTGDAQCCYRKTSGGRGSHTNTRPVRGDRVESSTQTRLGQDDWCFLPGMGTSLPRSAPTLILGDLPTVHTSAGKHHRQLQSCAAQPCLWISCSVDRRKFHSRSSEELRLMWNRHETRSNCNQSKRNGKQRSVVFCPTIAFLPCSA